VNTTKPRLSLAEPRSADATVSKLKFTEAAIRKLTAPPNARLTYSDSGGSGLRLQVSGPNRRHPDGCRKVYKVALRLANGEQFTVTLSPTSPALPLDTAKTRLSNCGL
jgi:hypothetical protein